MAFELITGHAGRNHVDSADMGEAFAGIVGKGRYILDTGEGMACSMADSNTLTVGTGSMLMDGRIVRNETAATFKIANGTQGQYRHDLACLRYTLDRSNDSIESVEQVVLQGTPATTASEAKDPEYEAGDILSGDLSATVPIVRVKLDNLTPTCEAMLGSVTSLKSLGDSVSQISKNPKIYVGTKVVNSWGTAGQLKVFTPTEFSTLFGGEFGIHTHDCVLVMNGDGNANGAYLSAAGHWAGDGIWVKTLNGSGSGPIRINYVVVRL